VEIGHSMSLSLSSNNSRVNLIASCCAASIIGDFGLGYQDGKNHTYNDFYAGINDDSRPSGVSTSYCSESFQVNVPGKLLASFCLRAIR
jgi:hypothetical protein